VKTITKPMNRSTNQWLRQRSGRHHRSRKRWG